ncbi:serine/threonine-protein kinase [Spirosoma arcticum]
MSTVSFNTHFPGYDVLGEIGRSNARVLKARHIATGDLVAIKHFTLNTDPDTLRRFERESQIMTQIDHPNIVRVREVRLDAELPYLVMDYIEGGTARQLITEQGSLPVELTIRLGLQVLDAFRLIHAQGIVHRDVKPENILYRRLASGELHFLLTDFGVARLHEQPVTMTGQSLMTYEYAAPEQFDNPRQVNESADYYALGVVLYECLTGRVPFAMGSETGIVQFMNAVLTTPPPAPVLPTNQPLPGSLETLLQQLLAKKPGERIHSADAVKLTLKQAEVEQLHREQAQPTSSPTAQTEVYRHRPMATSAAARSSTSQSDRPAAGSGIRSRRRLMPVALIAGFVLLAGSGVYWFYTTTNRPSEAAQVTTKTTNATETAAVQETPQEDSRQRLELARQRYQAQVMEGYAALNAQAFGGKTGLFGGVKELSVRLRNPSLVTFKSVAVKVQYIKENGDLFKSTVMYFNNIGPDATVIRRAPDSQRGTRFSARVLRADAERPDSIAVPTPLTP